MYTNNNKLKQKSTYCRSHCYVQSNFILYQIILVLWLSVYLSRLIASFGRFSDNWRFHHQVQLAGRPKVVGQQQHRPIFHAVHGLMPRQDAVQRLAHFAADESHRFGRERHNSLVHGDVAEPEKVQVLD